MVFGYFMFHFIASVQSEMTFSKFSCYKTIKTMTNKLHFLQMKLTILPVFQKMLRDYHKTTLNPFSYFSDINLSLQCNNLWHLDIALCEKNRFLSRLILSISSSHQLLKKRSYHLQRRLNLNPIKNDHENIEKRIKIIKLFSMTSTDFCFRLDLTTS